MHNEEVRISLRARVASYLDRSSLGIYLELIQAALSLFSCGIYIAETYYDSGMIPKWMNLVDIALCAIFGADFLLHVFIAEKKWSYVFSRYGMIDLLTILPVFLGLAISGLNSYRHLFFFIRPARVLRAVRILRFLPAVTKSTAARRQLIFLIYSAACLVFIFSGLFQYVENNEIFTSVPVRGHDQDLPFLTFHEAVYFTVILAYTVSFGNPVPTNSLGKFVTMSYIVVTALVIPLQIRKLIKILAMQKDGGWVVKSKRRRHYIVTGSINATNFSNFLTDFFDARQKHDKTRVVVLSNNEATDDYDIIHVPYLENKVIWLVGSVLLPIDLKRSQSGDASGAFIFADSIAYDPVKEDKLNILRALTLRRHSPNMRISVQLIDSSMKTHVEDGTSQIFAFALDEVKMNLLVWSTLYPGFSTLISNMLMWRLQIPLPPNPPDWLKEYADSLHQSLFEVEVPHRYVSDTFANAVSEVYNQHGIAVVGIRKSGSKKITLAPINIDMRLSMGDSFILLAGIHQLQGFSDNRFQTNLRLTQPGTPSLYKIPVIGKMMKKADVLDSFRLDVEQDTSEMEEESMQVGESRDIFFHEGMTHRPKKRFAGFQRKKKGHVNLDSLYTSSPSTGVPRSPSRAFQLMDLASMTPPKKLPTHETAHEKGNKRSLAECTITKLDPNVSQHIVLCGCPRSRFGLYHFVQPLLSSYVGNEEDEPILVVILSPDPPSQATWDEVAEMPNIRYLKGSGLKTEDQLAAGIERSRAVVVLSNVALKGEHAGKKQGLTTVVEAVDAIYSQDADVILTTRSIHSTLSALHTHVFTISEMSHTKTFNLLSFAKETEETEFFLSPGFAAGYFYDAGITERLIYQCHEKQFLKDIFNKIFPNKLKKRATFISQIPCPTNVSPLTYGNVFNYAIRHEMIPIGLYRPVEGEGSEGNFVTINPPASTPLQERDRIFVWCSVLK